MAKRKKKDQVFKESSMNNIDQSSEAKDFSESLVTSQNKYSAESSRERRDGPGGN